MSDDNHIGSWNGHRGTPQDRLAKGCIWVFAIILGFVVAMGIVGYTIEAVTEFNAAQRAHP